MRNWYTTDEAGEIVRQYTLLQVVVGVGCYAISVAWPLLLIILVVGVIGGMGK